MDYTYLYTGEKIDDEDWSRGSRNYFKSLETRIQKLGSKRGEKKTFDASSSA